MNTFADVLFILLSAGLLAVVVLWRSSFVVAVYLGGYIIFGLGAHLGWRLAEGVTYDLATYLITHMASFGFLLLLKRKRPT